MNPKASGEQALDPLQSALDLAVTYGPAILKVIAIAIIGWIVALVIRAATRTVLQKVNANRHAKSLFGEDVDVANGVATAVYFLCMLVVLIAIASAVQIEAVSGPIQALANPIFAFLPRLVAAIVIGIVGWALATVLRTLVTRLLGKTSLDEKLSTSAGTTPLSETLGTVLYGVVLLLTVPLVLDVLQLTGLLEPVQAMFAEALSFIPNVLAAIVIGVVGWFIAKILRDLVASLSSTIGADKLGARLGLSEEQPLSKLFGLIVYVLVLVPTVISALQVLGIEAITRPATSMLQMMMAAVPNIVGAALIIAIAYGVATIVAPLVGNVASAVGLNKIPKMLGVEALVGENTLARFLEGLVKFIILVFAAIEAGARLGFEAFAGLLSSFIDFGADVLLGTVILVVGFVIARFAYRAILSVGGEGATVLANIARVAIIGLVLAMGLGAMGVANDIVELAFGLTIAAVAVAFALAFGLGGREAAKQLTQHAVDRWIPSQQVATKPSADGEK